GGISVPGDGGKATALTIPSVSGLSTTYLARLVLADSGGTVVSRNVYWLSTKADVIDYANNQWFYAPTTALADLTGLGGMAQATVSATAGSAAHSDGNTTTTVTLKNTGSGKTTAFYVDAHVLGAGAESAQPIRCNDNQAHLSPAG